METVIFIPSISSLYNAGFLHLYYIYPHCLLGFLCPYTFPSITSIYPSLITWQKWHLIDYLDLENVSTYYSLIFTEFAQGQSRSCVQLCLLCRSFPKQDTTRQSEARGRSTITPHCFNPLNRSRFLPYNKYYHYLYA